MNTTISPQLEVVNTRFCELLDSCIDHLGQNSSTVKELKEANNKLYSRLLKVRHDDSKAVKRAEAELYIKEMGQLAENLDTCTMSFETEEILGRLDMACFYAAELFETTQTISPKLLHNYTQLHGLRVEQGVRALNRMLKDGITAQEIAEAYDIKG